MKCVRVLRVCVCGGGLALVVSVERVESTEKPRLSLGSWKVWKGRGYPENVLHTRSGCLL